VQIGRGRIGVPWEIGDAISRTSFVLLCALGGFALRPVRLKALNRRDRREIRYGNIVFLQAKADSSERSIWIPEQGQE